jgi:hypothetical protein
MLVSSNSQQISGLILLFCAFTVSAQAKGIPAHGPAIVLFDGKDLNHFDTFLPSAGPNSDPNQQSTCSCFQSKTRQIVAFRLIHLPRASSDVALMRH